MMKYLLLSITFLIFCTGCGTNHHEEFNGDFKLEEGARGELGKSGSSTFKFKEAYFKIPDEYNTGYDSVQIILGWGDEPIVNFCYPKH